MAAARNLVGHLRHFSSTRTSFLPLSQLCRGISTKTAASPPPIASILKQGRLVTFSPFRQSNIYSSTLLSRVRFASSSPSPTALSGKALSRTFFTSTRNFAEAQSAIPEVLPPLTPLSVSRWLFGSALLVFGIIVVGGVTRLTESGLSITEWKPITGTLPPLSQAEWEEEFEKYKQSPEFKM